MKIKLSDFFGRNIREAYAFLESIWVKKKLDKKSLMSDNREEMDSKNLIWTCHLCGNSRPDAFISVMKHPIVVDGFKIGEQNVRYCNDSDICRKKAETFRFFTPQKNPNNK